MLLMIVSAHDCVCADDTFSKRGTAQTLINSTQCELPAQANQVTHDEWRDLIVMPTYVVMTCCVDT